MAQTTINLNIGSLIKGRNVKTKPYSSKMISAFETVGLGLGDVRGWCNLVYKIHSVDIASQTAKLVYRNGIDITWPINGLCVKYGIKI